MGTGLARILEVGGRGREWVDRGDNEEDCLWRDLRAGGMFFGMPERT